MGQLKAFGRENAMVALLKANVGGVSDQFQWLYDPSGSDVVCQDSKILPFVPYLIKAGGVGKPSSYPNGDLVDEETFQRRDSTVALVVQELASHFT
jgi:hypothetical protein